MGRQERDQKGDDLTERLVDLGPGRKPEVFKDIKKSTYLFIGGALLVGTALVAGAIYYRTISEVTKALYSLITQGGQ